jgi:uncharacterized membrane protein
MSSLLITAKGHGTQQRSNGRVYFAFSGFIMRALDKLESAQSVTAMNAINEIILRSLFMPVFFGSSIISLLLIVLALVYWDEAGTGLALIASMVYFVGMFVCTLVFNVPLNNELSRLDPTSDNAQQTWSHYLKNWTKWNHLRTASPHLSPGFRIQVHL